jgi:hypothetical protein
VRDLVTTKWAQQIFSIVDHGTGEKEAFQLVCLVSGGRFPVPRDTTPLAWPAACGAGRG